jgi:hypothetical protein
MAGISLPAGLTRVGRSSNCDYLVASPDVLIVVPDAGVRDDVTAAEENAAWQLDYARRLGRPCAVVVLMSRLLGQDPGARRVYSTKMDPELIWASALVVQSPLSRAIGSFFMGLSRPRFPARLFESVEGAIQWVESMRPQGAPA